MTRPGPERVAKARTRTLLRAMGAVFTSTFASIPAAVAQTSQAAPPLVAPVTPPVVQGTTDVRYPEGAHGDALVLLQLQIENDGSVSQAVVIEGSEPFAEQARRNVLTWRFRPARRGDVPIPARIRARVDFRQEVVTPNAPPGRPPVPTAPTALGTGQGR